MVELFRYPISVGHVLVDQYKQEWEVIAVVKRHGRIAILLHGPQLRALWYDYVNKSLNELKWKYRDWVVKK